MQQMEKLYIMYGSSCSSIRQRKATSNRTLQPYKSRTILTDEKGILGGKVIGGDLEVERGRSLSDTTGDVVVRAVAGAEPATVVTGFTDGHTTKVSADTCKK